jgi:geranylgeranyl pyrophosphate synthase
VLKKSSIIKFTMIAPSIAQIHIGIIVIIVIIITFIAGAYCYSWYINRKVRSALINIPRALPRVELLRKVDIPNILAVKNYETYMQEFNGLISRATELNEFGQVKQLAAACSHALIGGKRLRPILLMEIARAIACRDKREPVDAGDSALGVEYLHTASLVIDDLPDFDDDNIRRGQPSVHALTSPAVAQLAALSLVSSAFQNFCRQVDWVQSHIVESKYIDAAALRVCSEVSRVLGASGAAAGQFMDVMIPSVNYDDDYVKVVKKDLNVTADSVDSSKISNIAPLEPLNEDDSIFDGADTKISESEYISNHQTSLGDHTSTSIMEIIQLKTATVFELCLVIGALIAGGDEDDVHALREAGTCFGIAFQVADDIGDAVQDKKRQLAGKVAWNYAIMFGDDAARICIVKNLQRCVELLHSRGLYTPIWKEIFDKVWEMGL